MARTTRQHALFALNKVKNYRKKKSRRRKRQRGGVMRPRYGIGGPYSRNGELILY